MTHWPTGPPRSPTIPHWTLSITHTASRSVPDLFELHFVHNDMLYSNFEIVEKRENTKKHGLTLLPHYIFER